LEAQVSTKDYFEKRDRIFRIFDGPDKKDLWMRTPRIDSFQSAKEITQLPVQFLCELEERRVRFHVYLDNIVRMENDENSVLFRGTALDNISGDSVVVEGQYDFVARTGFLEIKEKLG
jgi:hypothetical protein